MTSITLHHLNGTKETGSVTTALQELATASRHLIAALWSSITQRSVPTALSTHEEAENLRAIADGLALRDPHFAQDLYAAADRHEWGANAD